MSDAAQEAVWIRRLLGEMGEPQEEATVIYEDNTGAIAVTMNPVLHRRMKHVDIRAHYVRELVRDKVVLPTYCSTNEMLADLLTKPLAVVKFLALVKALGMQC